MGEVVLLGPQRRSPRLREAVSALGLDGPACAITAGWQEREGELEQVSQVCGLPVRDLQLYSRARLALAEDRELAAALRRFQDDLRELQRLYRVRLGHALAAKRAVFRASRPRELVHPGRGLFVSRVQREALSAVRLLDRQHLRVIRRWHDDLTERWRPTERRAIAHQVEAIRRVLAETSAVFIAGGHVAVLLNRIRLFGLGPELAKRTVVAWSAGAMTLADRVVLFHDHPPEGPNDTEAFDVGLGLVHGAVFFPHADDRLDLDDPDRVRQLSRRFAPARCVTLDHGEWVHIVDDDVVRVEGVRRLRATGRVEPVTLPTRAA